MSTHFPFRTIVILLGAALVASVVVNILLGFYARQFYYTIGHLQLDPLGVSYYEVDVTMPPKDPHTTRVVFFGDSRAESWPAPAGLDDFRFINRGIGGQTSEQALGRFDVHVRPLQPDILVVQVGINDLQTITLFPSRRDEIVARCKENLQTLVADSLALDATVILTTIFPHGPITADRYFFWSDAVDAATDEVNTLIFSLASEGVLVLDSASVLQDERGLVHREYRRDFLHLNEAGYEALNVALSGLLRQIQDQK